MSLKIYKSLLVIGVCITLSTIYFVYLNPIYAVYSATIGLLIVLFSVFELVSLKKSPKPKKTSKAIASTKRLPTKKNDLEWTYYDINKRDTVGKDAQPLVQKQEQKKKRKNIFSHLAFWKKKPKEQKKPSKEPVIKKLKTKDERSQEKQKLLDQYVLKALESNVPTEKIFETALASDWPSNMVAATLKKLNKQRNKKKFTLLSITGVISVIILIILISTDTLLFGYWLDLLSSGSLVAYIVTLLALLSIIIFFLFRIRALIKKKKHVYRFVQAKNVTEYKKSVTKKEPVFGMSYQTDIDKLLELIEEKKNITVSVVAKTFNIKKSEAENWGKILKDQGLITIYYPTVGDPELRWKKEAKEET